VNATYTTEIYVDGSASANGGGNQASPFNTIVAAITAARNSGAGTRIHIAAGTYPAVQTISNLSGQVDAPIAIVAEGEVIIDAGNNGNGMAFSDVRYLVIDGLIVQNTGVHGLNIDDGNFFVSPSEFIVLRNMYFRNIGSGNNNDCLKMSGVDNFYIENSEFEGCNRGEAIDMVGCHNDIITGNHFHDVVGNAVQTKGGSSDILIHGNRFIDIPSRAINAGGNTGASFFRPDTAIYEARNISIIANQFIRTGSAAVVYSGCDTCVVAHNTIINPNAYVFWAVEENLSKGPGRNGYFINNIVVFNNADLNNFSFFNSNNLSLNNTFLIDANLWFSQDNSGFSRVPNGHGFPTGTNSVIQNNPMLDANNRITVISPAAGQGIDIPGLPVGTVIVDYEGNLYANPSSIGAFSVP